jgi:hypothetical protein
MVMKKISDLNAAVKKAEADYRRFYVSTRDEIFDIVTKDFEGKVASHRNSADSISLSYGNNSYGVVGVKVNSNDDFEVVVLINPTVITDGIDFYRRVEAAYDYILNVNSQYNGG